MGRLEINFNWGWGHLFWTCSIWSDCCFVTVGCHSIHDMANALNKMQYYYNSDLIHQRLHETEHLYYLFRSSLTMIMPFCHLEDQTHSSTLNNCLTLQNVTGNKRSPRVKWRESPRKIKSQRNWPGKYIISLEDISDVIDLMHMCQMNIKYYENIHNIAAESIIIDGLFLD